MAGDTLSLRLPCTALGREVRQMVVDQIPGKAGAKVFLHNMAEELRLDASLQQQLAKLFTLFFFFLGGGG